MTVRRRRQIAWTLRGLALLAVLAYLPGRQASRSGGLVEVERFDQPLLVGAAVVLLVVSVVVECEFRTLWSQIGCAAALVGLIATVGPVLLVAAVFGGHQASEKRATRPDRPDWLVTATDAGPVDDPLHHFELVTGSGWSARHWALGEWRGDGGIGSYASVEWTAPDRITVSSEYEVTVFTLDPATGRPGAPVVTRR
ncbi:hypothetical protein ACIQBJ_32695 [Kitasatospora sp. NPDC088391]|uniref:hypothetical protein n=1 Tax=Kitasatospora sp. NPDC088391 TaxID=3364074 RepID=UPI00380C1F28